MKKNTTTTPFGSRFGAIRLLAALVVALVLGGCNGPANPEPVMLTPGAVFLQDSAPGQVDLWGEAGAAEGADWMVVQNLDGVSFIDGPVDNSGAFGLLVDGVSMDRYRLIAFNDTGGFASLVVTSDGVTPGVTLVPEADVGCLRVEPTYLDLGAGPAGEPLYGELTVTNECGGVRGFMTQETANPYFTPASLLLVEPLDGGGRATVSVVFLAPAGTQQALLVLEPDLTNPDPEQLPLQVVLKAEAQP